MRLKIRHTTRYDFETPVKYGLQQLRKTPKTTTSQEVLSWTTRVEGGVKQLEFEDYHRNKVELITFDDNTTSLTVDCEGEIQMSDTHGVIGPHRGPAPLWMYLRSTDRTRCGNGCRALAKKAEGENTLERLHALSHVILDAVRYEVGTSDAGWTAEEAVSAGAGVCQDHAHIFIAAARSLGVPARYVSGYLKMDERDEQDASHAWAEAHVDGLGWVGFDVSNGISPDLRYVRVATGLDYSDAAPVTGTRFGGEGERLSVEIEVAQQ